MLRQGLHCLAVLIGMPLFFALHKAPHWPEAVVFMTMLLPLSALVFVALTDVLHWAQILVSFSLCLMAMALASAGAGMGSVGAALFLAAVEAFITFDPVMIGLAALATAGAVAGISLLRAPLSLPASTISVLDLLCLAGSLFYGLALMLHAVHLHKVEAQRARRRNPDLLPLIHQLGDFVVVHDRSGTAWALNRHFEHHLGLPPDDLMGRGLFDHVHVLDRPAFLRAIADAAGGEGASNITIRLRGRGEDLSSVEPCFRWFDVCINRFENGHAKKREEAEADDQAMIIGVYRDISAMRRVEQELDAARVAAETANQAKDRFLANMSHELRTPLNAIIGFSEMLADPQLCPQDPLKQREYAAIIHSSGEHLLHVVNSILDMSKIHSGTFPLQPQPIVLAPLIASCCAMLRPQAEAKEIELVQIHADPWDEIVADQQACKQILLNLLSNAVKFTPRRGRVTIAVDCVVDCLDDIQIAVQDTGIGISADDLTRLGEPFFQAMVRQERPHEGTGLGLSIVRGLVELHGGTLLIESEPDQGTSMIVRLPREGRPQDKTEGREWRTETQTRRGVPAEISVLKEAKVKKIA
ncbi:multi-sensor signal transduction histidine kinase [Beijerinckia indica subsp. indica ATCC 9039]|uniref:histidine kinase n=2 Tax=Beijerinckia TaxID=532 RepID=B2IC15_BEII9|nr:multi-sensor signal transduction histidine kinase [Beijerinckia indica subsp. indica ATCC 9039]